MSSTPTTVKVPETLGWQFGLFAGLGCVIAFLLFYLAGGPALAIQTWWIKIIIIVGLMLAVLYRLKKANKGFVDFRKGLKHTFAIGVASVVIWFVFRYFFFEHIDREMLHQLALENMRTAAWMAESSGKEISPIALKKIADDVQNMGIGDYAIKCALTIIFTFFLAIISAAIYYWVTLKNRPNAIIEALKKEQA